MLFVHGRSNISKLMTNSPEVPRKFLSHHLKRLLRGISYFQHGRAATTDLVTAYILGVKASLKMISGKLFFQANNARW